MFIVTCKPHSARRQATAYRLHRVHPLGSGVSLAPSSRRVRPRAPSSAASPGQGGSLRVRCAKEGVSFSETLDGTSLRVGVVRSRWNEDITESLLEAVRRTLKECQVADDNVVEVEVPGAFELPLAARLMIETQRVDAVVCLGCLIKGETSHFDLIADKASAALMQLQMSTQTPIVFGILTCTTMEQAKARSTGANNHGIEWAKTAVEMGTVKNVMLGKRPAGKESKKLLF